MTLWKLQSIFLQKLYMYHTTFFYAVPTLFLCSINAPLNVDLGLIIFDLRLKVLYMCESQDAQQLLSRRITGLW